MFGKIFEQIYDSSIAEDWQTRIVFQDLIVLADANGIIDRTPESIARRTNVPLEIILRAIKRLEAPDPKSRSSKSGGARIERLDPHRDWGWSIVNHGKYRNVNGFDKKAYMRNYMREKRAEDSDNQQELDRNSNGVLQGFTAASASVSVLSESSGGGVGGGAELPHNFPPTVDDACRVVAMFCPDAAFVTSLWNGAMARNGCDGAGQPISRWANYVAKHWPKEQERKSRPGTSGNGGNGLRPNEIRTVIEAKKLRAAEVKRKGCSEVAMGETWSDQKLREEYAEIQRDIKKLNRQIEAFA